MENVIIRKAVLSDIPHFFEICLKTGDSGRDASEIYFDPYLLGYYYASPYLLFPDGVCFVAEYEYCPQGYIIAAPDTLAFNKWMEEEWLPPLRRRYPLPFPPEKIRSEKEKKLIETLHINLCTSDTDVRLTNYPAHLHIDLLPCLQGKGMGSKLMNTLFVELKKRGIPGIHLGVGSSNTDAIEFYKKLGFSVLQEQTWGFTMGYKL
ncbi:MAG: GNAT family N-acetyltransferase [Treponema sp.]|nr:GNAT family N-acetyltransferase [Treponema sp.]